MLHKKTGGFNMINSKKIIAAVIACVASVSIAATNASAYSLRYAYGSPSNVNVLTDTDVSTSTGKGYISVSSTEFSVQISGAYVNVSGSSHTTSPLTVNTVGTYRLNYSGASVPKSGVRVSVALSLQNYSVSKGVTASGSILA